jgi:hypothetical protein
MLCLQMANLVMGDNKPASSNNITDKRDDNQSDFSVASTSSQ